jgi:hypothetical protein
MFRNRSVVEVMVLIFTLVVAFSLVATGFWVAFIEIRNPEADTDSAVDVLFTTPTVILGALLGLLAGKSEGVSELSDRPDNTKDDVTGTGPPQ